MIEKALLGIVLFPLLGAVANGLFGRTASRRVVHTVAVTSVAVAFVLSVWSFKNLLMLRMAGHEHAALSYTAYEWFSISAGHRVISVPVRFVMDALSGVMCLVVTGIGLLIHIYSTGYMSEEKSFARFFAYLNLFTASMLILVLGSNLPLMFVGWEGVGLCSYLLIGFWFENPNYAAAGRKAFIANRIGDFGVLIGMFLLVSVVHSFEFADINQFAHKFPALLKAPIALGPSAAPYLGITGAGLATVATLFLFLGCTGKSAQIPLYVWLPDAMAGPTPVSALIHAATMVTSGVYLICRLSPVFALAPATMAVIAVIGALTALLAASIGMVQNDIKKVLAYSTVSQLGFMFAAVGCGAFAAGFMHVYTHAFFKACLFLGAGSVMHAVGAHGDADIRTLGGLRKYMPQTRITFLVSCMAIAGVPFFSGFFSKDEILVGALNAGDYFSFAPWLGRAVFAMLFVGAIMTAFYMFRLYFLTFSGEYRGGPVHEHQAPAAAHASPVSHDEGDHAHDVHAQAHEPHEPHESPVAMTLPLVILGAGAAVAGYVWVGAVHFEPWVSWLEPALGSIGVPHNPNAPMLAMAFGMTAVAVGIGLAYSFYFKGSDVPKRWAEQLPALYRLVMDKWRVDELYDATVLAFSRFLGRFCAAFDKFVVDGVLSELTSQVIKASSFVFTRMQNGLVHAYGAVMVLGLLAISFHFVVPHPDPELASEPSGMKVTLTAPKGLGYEYRWDFDGDGKFDTPWSVSPRVEHDFAGADFKHFVAVFTAATYGARPQTRLIALGHHLSVSKTELGPAWRSGEDATLPTITADEHGLVIRPNGARVRKGGAVQGAHAEVHVGRGESVTIGQAQLAVTGFMRPRVQVRNAFGMQRVGSLDLVLPAVASRSTVQVAALAGGAQ